MDDTVGFMRGREAADAEWRLLRKKARAAMKETMAAKWLEVGLAERALRDTKLSALRLKRAAAAAEKVRLGALELKVLYSQLVEMGNEALKDQLKKRKLLGATGFTVTQPNRTAYVLQLQTLLLAADPAANDLSEGDSGIVGRNIKRKTSVKASGGGKVAGKKRKKGDMTRFYMDYSWTEEEEDSFKVEAIVGK
eukprot:4161368-Prymnesium_polylepis.1